MDDDMDDDVLTAEERADLEKIRLRKTQIVTEHRIKKSSHNNNPVMPAKHRAPRENTAAKMEVSLRGRAGRCTAPPARQRGMRVCVCNACLRLGFMASGLLSAILQRAAPQHGA